MIHTADLPVIFTTDALIEPFLRSLDNVLMSLESSHLEPLLYQVLTRSREYLLRNHPEGESESDVRDVLEVALKLLRPEAEIGSVRPSVQQILGAIDAETMVSVRLFGRTKKIDFSQFEPRGHYAAETNGLDRYFKAMMWLSRSDLGFELSGSTASLRAKMSALILWDCVVNSGAYADWLKIDDVISYVVGPSDGLSIRTLGFLMKDLNLSGGRAAISRFNETTFDTLLVRRPYGMQMILSEDRIYAGEVDDLSLPRICNFMPQRFTIDSYSFSQLVYPLTQLRLPSSLHIAFLLGDNTALTDDSTLNTNKVPGILSAQHALYRQISSQGWQSSLYPQILRLLMELNGIQKNSAVSPVFRTATWQRKMRNAQLAGWAQLRAANLLYVKQSYTGGACYFPTAYVEPYPAFFSGVRQMAVSASAKLRKIDPSVSNYFDGLAEISGNLAAAAQRTAQGQDLTLEQVEWMNRMITSAVHGPASLGYVAKVYDGWYFDLVYNAETLDGPNLPMPYTTEDGRRILVREFDPDGPDDPFRTRSYVTIADVHTKPMDPTGPAQVLHAATGFVQLMAVVVHIQGKPTLFVGPVSSYYDVITSGQSPERVTKEEWRERLLSQGMARPWWTKSFLYDK